MTLRGAAILACVAAVVCIVVAMLGQRAFMQAYLTAYLFAIGFPLGALGLLLLYQLTGGKWGVAAAPVLHAATSLLPVMALLFLPILLQSSLIYEWSHADAVVADPLLEHKRLYLNLPFFIVRAAVYFVIWTTLAVLLRRPGPHPRLGAGGLILYVLTVTFAAIDWAMSLTPHWYSTLWGALFIVSQGLCALTMSIAALAWITRRATSADVSHDLGNLLLAFVSLWAYLSFSQYLIIWSANLAEEVTWYVPRVRGGWGITGCLLIILHFAVPFALLLSRPMKRDIRRLGCIAAGVVAGQAVHMFWLIVPSFDRGLSWRDPVVLAGVLCFCSAIGSRRLETAP